MRIVYALTSVAILSIAATAIGAGGQKTVTITDKDKEAKATLAKGDTLLVKLAANPTTGFTWELASKDNPNLKLTGKPTYEAEDKNKVGGGGTQTFTFTAAGAGEVDLEFHYRRPFEKDKEPAKTFKAKVTIK